MNADSNAAAQCKLAAAQKHGAPSDACTPKKFHPRTSKTSFHATPPCSSLPKKFISNVRVCY